MEWMHTLAIMGSVIGSGYYFTRDIREDIKFQTERLEQQGKRTDKLYEMFIDLLKEGRK